MLQRDLFVIAYDISCPRRQRRVRRLLQGYSTGGQKSFFECWLSRGELMQISRYLQEELEGKGDRLHIFRLGEKSEPRLFGKAATLAQNPLMIL